MKSPALAAVRRRLYDDLKRVWPNIEPFRFTAASKTPLIQSLAVAIEQGQVRWPRAWTVLTDEIKWYECHGAGLPRRSLEGEGGFHDDCVVALALGNTGLRPGVYPMLMAALGGRRVGGWSFRVRTVLQA